LKDLFLANMLFSFPPLKRHADSKLVSGLKQFSMSHQVLPQA